MAAMVVDGPQLAAQIETTIRQMAAAAGGATEYREPLIAYVAAEDPRLAQLRAIVHESHMLPSDLLPGAKSIVSFFLPFAPWVLEANAQGQHEVAREWAVAYVETNALIGRMTSHLIDVLAGQGIRAAAEPATHNFDPVNLISRWAHKSVAVIAGLGSFGLHQLVITDAGCAGRFGSLVLDAKLPVTVYEQKERCLYYHDGSCMDCVQWCPVEAIDPGEPLDKQRCRARCRDVAQVYAEIGLVQVCGKCAIGPCAFESAVP
jgi:epoxyqueuosine reductase QueG